MQAKIDQTQLDYMKALQCFETQKFARSTMQEPRLEELDLKAAQGDCQGTVKDFKGGENNLSYPLPEVWLVSEPSATDFVRLCFNLPALLAVGASA